VRVVSDDWFYARIYGDEILTYSSEKNFYIRADLAKIWSEFAWLVDRAVFDEEGRAVVDLRLAIGKGRILPLSTLRTLIILKRDANDSEVVQELTVLKALNLIERNGYFNPHLLVHNKFKQKLRNKFFESLLRRVNAYEVNTVETPGKSQDLIRKIVGML
jgi:hypothetical protein